MIDNDGFRANVGVILCNKLGQVLWCRRIGDENAWQFPQGGVQPHESEKDALFREIHEEIGLQSSDVSIIAMHKRRLRYRLPKQFVRKNQRPQCIGQAQRWFLVALNKDDNAINLALTTQPEFSDWQWVSYWYPVKQIVAFKKSVYVQALKGLAPAHASFVKEQQALDRIQVG